MQSTGNWVVTKRSHSTREVSSCVANPHQSEVYENIISGYRVEVYFLQGSLERSQEENNFADT